MQEDQTDQEEQFTIRHSRGGAMGPNYIIERNGRFVAHLYPDGSEDDVDALMAKFKQKEK